MSIDRQKEYYTRPENTPPPGLSSDELMQWDMMIETTADKVLFNAGDALLDAWDVMKEEMNKSRLFKSVGIRFK